MSEKYIGRSSQIAARVLGGEMMVMSSVDYLAGGGRTYSAYGNCCSKHLRRI